jgi:hypothetical protein
MIPQQLLANLQSSLEAASAADSRINRVHPMAGGPCTTGQQLPTSKLTLLFLVAVCGNTPARKLLALMMALSSALLLAKLL